MRKELSVNLWNYCKLFILVFLILLMAVTCFDTFFTLSNLSSILTSIALYGIMTCGMLFPALVSGPDLSISGTASVGSMLLVKTIVASGNTNAGFFSGILYGMLVGLMIGMVLGALIHFLKAPSFLITLSAQYILFGITQLGTESKTINCYGPDLFLQLGNGRFLGFPIQVYLFLLIALITYFLMHRTVFGRKVFAVGGNAKASALCGTSNKKIDIASFGISGLMAAISGMLLAAMNQQASASAGSGYEIQVLLSVIIGGVNMGFGIGSVWGVMYGSLFVGLLNNGMRLLGVPSMYQTLLVGLLIIAAVAMEGYFMSKASGMHWKKRKPKRAAG